METNPEERKIEIEQESLGNLDVARKWASFVAIVGFMLIGLLILIGLLTGVFLSLFNAGESDRGIPSVVMVLIFLILGVIYFFPALFLFRFSKQTSRAIHSLDKHELTRAIRNLKYYFVFIGSLIILGIVLYLVMFIITGASTSFLKGLG